MIYLDYAANTPVSDEVLEFFCKYEQEYIANPNSLHDLGLLSHKAFESITKQMKELLMLENRDIIITSGASQANRIAMQCNINTTYKVKKHIITSYLEHNSILGVIPYLKDNGYEVDFVDILPSGLIDIEHLKELLTHNTVVVSICMIDSEIGIVQPIEEIAKVIASYPNCVFHCDMTQSVGKIPVPINHVDLATFSPHKFNGINGTGILVKREDILLSNQDNEGTPTLSLYASTKKALELSLFKREISFEHVVKLREYLIKSISKYKKVFINTPYSNSTPYIINISLIGVKANLLRDYLSQNGICISTKSACSSDNNQSRAVYALTKDRKRALSSVRISISSLTTMEEIEIFLSCFDKAYKFFVQ